MPLIFLIQNECEILDDECTIWECMNVYKLIEECIFDQRGANECRIQVFFKVGRYRGLRMCEFVMDGSVIVFWKI